MNYSKRLSNASLKLKGQEMFQILDRAKKIESNGKKVFHLEIGDPEFNTPVNVINACIKALKRGYTHYSSSSGLSEFKKAAKSRFLKSRKFEPNDNQILVTQGANIQIFYAMFCICNPGDEVILPDPGFVSYSSIANSLGIKINYYSLKIENKYQPNIINLKKLINKKTKFILINSPHNPTGSILTKESIIKIYNICKKNKIYLLSDEVYARLIFDKNNFYSPSSIDKCKQTTVVLHSFSKSYAMTGWRIGAVTGPSFLIKRMQLLLETTTSCVSPFIQLASIKAITSSQKAILEMNKEILKNRNIVTNYLKNINKISFYVPKGTFYIFIDISKITKDDVSFSNKLLKTMQVAICPGSYFGINGRGYIRLSFAIKKYKLLIALSRFKKFILNY